MNIFTGVIVYLMIFWTALFMILPWGNDRDENTQKGNMTGAPARSNIKRKFIITAILSSILWLLVFFLVHFEVINFYEIARDMVDEDYQ